MSTNEAFELKPNGVVLFEWEGGEDAQLFRRTLRRPSLAEYEILVERLTELSSRIDAERPGSGLKATEQWIETVFHGDEELGLKGLADQPLPTPDKRPSWLVAGEVARDLVSHWQTVPGRRGA